MNFESSSESVTMDELPLHPGSPTCVAVHENFVSDARLQTFQTCHGHFLALEESLHAALGFSRSQHKFLGSRASTARAFGVQLLNDALAIKTSELLNPSGLQVIEAEAGFADAVTWLDLVHEDQFEPQLQENGKYHCRIHKHNALVTFNQRDYELIMTRREFTYSMKYPSDISAEKDTLALIASALSSWNKICRDFLDTNNASLALITGRLQALDGQLSGMPGSPSSPQPESRCDSATEQRSATGQDIPVARYVEESPTPPSHEGRLGGGRWDPKDVEKTGKWYPAVRHLPPEVIQRLFEIDFRHFRTADAIRAAAYRASQKPALRSGRGGRGSRGKIGRVSGSTERLGPNESPNSKDCPSLFNQSHG